MSFEIRLFLMEALVTFEINKLETILAQGRELPQTYSHLKILPEFHQENKSVSPCLYFYVLVFYSFVCCGFCCLWVQKYEKNDKDGRKSADNVLFWHIYSIFADGKD